MVVLDSCFSVLEALIELRKNGVFAAAVAKKRRYWPKYVLGGLFDQRMKNRNIGEVETMKGKIDDIPYNIFCLKEPEYYMKMMSTYGAGMEDYTFRKNKRTYKKEDGSWVTAFFHYTEVFANHFRFRHAVDDHNNLRHKLPSIEETWVTCHWMNRVFAFLLAISEVNAFLAFCYFFWSNEDKESMTIHAFRKKLALELIHNDEYEEQDLSVP